MFGRLSSLLEVHSSSRFVCPMLVRNIQVNFALEEYVIATYITNVYNPVHII